MSEAASFYTVDAEEDEVVAHLLSFTPSKDQHSEENTARLSRSERDSLLTLPASDDMIPLDHLFTPEPQLPSDSKHARSQVISPTPSPPPPKLFMSHIMMPHLRRPKSDYVWLGSLVSHPVAKGTNVKKPRGPSRGPSSLGDVLQSAWQNNLELGMGPLLEDVIRKKQKKRERREEHVTIVAKSSKLSTSGISDGDTKPKPKHKRLWRDGCGLVEPEKMAKRPRIMVDLTMSDEGCLQRSNSKPLIPKPPSLQTQRRGKPDSSHLALDVIQPAPSQVAYDSDDSPVVILESTPREPVQRVPPPPPVLTRPPKKIDLAEQFRKKKVKEKQVSNVPSPSLKKQFRPLTKSPKKSGVGNAASSASIPLQYSAIHAQNLWGLASTPTSIDSVSVEDNETEVRSFPSAKALGKRKAITPPLQPTVHYPPILPSINALQPHLSPLFTSSQYSPTLPDGNADVSFMYPNSGPDIYAGWASASGQERLGSILDDHHDPATLSSQLLYQTHRAPVQEAILSEALPILNNFDSIQADEGPWAPFSDQDASRFGYAFDTIDPTLLGGESVVINHKESQSVLEETQSRSEIQIALPSSSWASVTSSSSSATLSSTLSTSLRMEDGTSIATTNTDKYDPPVEPEIRVLDRILHVDTDFDSRSSSKTGKELSRQRRIVKQRQMTDMGPIDQIDTFADTTMSDYRLFSSSDDEGSSSESSQAITSKLPPLSKAVQKRTRRNQAPNEEVKRGAPMKAKHGLEKNWPTTSNPASCHQCRIKNTLVKISCLGCSKRYCVRCLSIRYPDEKFDPSNKAASCPACKGCCNCTVCCRKRGVKYVSSDRREMEDTTPVDNSPADRAKRIIPGGKTNLPLYVTYHAQPPPLSSGLVYWGTLYDLSGKRIGRGYVDPKGTTWIESAKAPAVPFRPSKRREFIGKVQLSWGLGRQPKICELQPVLRAKELQNNRVPRCYVGKKRSL